jgi:predicted Zn finger-like uncharacterized protein
MVAKEDETVVVICPKCKTKLKVNEGKISEGGSRFKCPKCSTVLLVKKPASVPQKPVNNVKVIVAHSNPSTVNQLVAILNENGYQTTTSSDGIEAMVKAIKELPFLMILEVSLPKIYGFEVCKRLKLRPEAKGMKFILVSSTYDSRKYKREPQSLYEADDYIEEHRLSELLIDSINRINRKEADQKKDILQKPAENQLERKSDEESRPEIKPESKPPEQSGDEKIERAKRLARAIVSDIYLYNIPKAEAAIKNDTFYSAFASEIREGLKLYENRIAKEVRDRGDFFRDTIREFTENKKKVL